MRIVTCLDNGMTFDGGREFAPNESILLGDWAAEQVEQRLNKRHSKVRNSSAEDYTRRPRPSEFKPGDVLISSRGLAIGDQLVWAGLLRFIKSQYPFLKIVHYCAPAIIKLLYKDAENLPFEVRPDPIPFKDWQAAQWHLVGEGLNEDDFEPEQPNIWEGHLTAAGFNPKLVHSSCRRPFLPCSAADELASADYISSLKHSATSTPQSAIVLWHLAASSQVRSYPPMLTRQAIHGLIKAGCRVIAVGSREQIKEYSPLPEGVILPPAGIPLRTLLVLCGKVDCVVCPDSCFSWAAAATGTACVSLWGAFLPEDRVGTDWPGHRPLTGRMSCSPCRKHEKPWLKPGCPAHGGYCQAIAEIQPDDIVQKVKEVSHDKAVS